MKKHITGAGLLSMALLVAAPAWAQSERETLEVLRQTTLSLIETLVEAGALTREKADALVKKAAGEAAKKLAAQKDAPAPVRVHYVPEIVRNEIREQIKQEVIAQARTERWAEPNAIPAWLDSIRWEGDLRLRYQLDDFAAGNSTPANYAFAAGTSTPNFPLSGDTTRAAELAAVNNSSNRIPTANTTEKRERHRLRARIGLLAKISPEWSAGVRLATGSATDRVSTNQTLGQDWNRYAFLVDRAFVRYDPVESLSLVGGRIPNPWFSTDLVWDDDLNFEGMALTWKPLRDNAAFKPFLTAGAFPVKEENPPASSGRWMHGVQAGAQWDIRSDTRFKFGLAWYGFRNFEGRVENDAVYDASVSLPNSSAYGQYEYGRNLRQKGNTLFVTNASAELNDPFAPAYKTAYWGLASRFRPLNLTASLAFARFDPVHVILTADWVKNTAFDRNEIAARTAGRVNLADGKNHGYQYRLTLGRPQLRNLHDWQVALAYRYLGSDAVVDAFTDSDFGGGGTNLKGYTLGFQYAVDRNAAVGLRWLSADQIDSFAPGAGLKFSLDVLQADVNVRF
ncbi:MAG: putative porin [Sulfuritalea sp.]|nr:putative porin [Sulfuritalea sp.]